MLVPRSGVCQGSCRWKFYLMRGPNGTDIPPPGPELEVLVVDPADELAQRNAAHRPQQEFHTLSASAGFRGRRDALPDRYQQRAEDPDFGTSEGIYEIRIRGGFAPARPSERISVPEEIVDAGHHQNVVWRTMARGQYSMISRM